MANINNILGQLDKNEFYVIKQTTSFEDGKYNESDKECIGKFEAGTAKEKYVELYRDARIDGIKPTIRAFEGLYNRIPQWGLKITSTEVTYWILKNTADWMKMYSKPLVDGVAPLNLTSTAIVPSKGYVIEWNAELKVWDVYGYGTGGNTIFLGQTKYAKAIDLTHRVWNKDGWHCNVIRIDMQEEPLPEDAVEITDGKHRKLRVTSTEYGIFTSMGETYAKGSFATTHTK